MFKYNILCLNIVYVLDLSQCGSNNTVVIADLTNNIKWDIYIFYTTGKQACIIINQIHTYINTGYCSELS